jgi:hypothetical protein
MSLLIPWSAIEPVAYDILGAGARPEGANPQEGRAVQHGLAGAPVRLRAEVGSLRMPVERMLALTPGTLLTLEDRAEHGVRLYAEGVPLGRAQPGLRGARRAIKLTSAMAPGPAPAELMIEGSTTATSQPPGATTGAEVPDGEGASDGPGGDGPAARPPRTWRPPPARALPG